MAIGDVHLLFSVPIVGLLIVALAVPIVIVILGLELAWSCRLVPVTVHLVVGQRISIAEIKLWLIVIIILIVPVRVKDQDIASAKSRRRGSMILIVTALIADWPITDSS